MAIKEPKEITVIKGPEATGKAFAFRIAKDREDKDGNTIKGSGKIEVGETPVKIKLDTPEALRVNLAAAVRSMVQKRYLKDVNAPERKNEKARAS